MKSIAWLAAVLTLVAAFVYTAVSLARWEWNRALFFAILFVAVEVGLASALVLRRLARVESLEARPEARFRVRVTGSGFDSEWSWRLEPVAGGTRVIHAATFEPFDRWTGILVRLGRASLSSRVEAHLRVLKERAEAAQRVSNPAT